MITSKLEILVDFGQNPNESQVEKTIKELKSQDGICQATFKDGAFLVETTLPSSKVLNMVIKSSGRRAVLQGYGDSQSAVAMISSQECCNGNVMGVVRFQQSDKGLVADGVIDGLPTGQHGLHVHSNGDLSQGCKLIGEHFNPNGTCHGGPEDPPDRRHVGDLGNIVADETGRATFRICDSVLKVWDIIGRSIAITELPDDLGKGDNELSKINGNSGEPLGCGIIARSAGVFENPKRICLCDGVVVWDEAGRPLAGKGRRDPARKSCCQKHEDVHNESIHHTSAKI